MPSKSPLFQSPQSKTFSKKSPKTLLHLKNRCIPHIRVASARKSLQLESVLDCKTYCFSSPRSLELPASDGGFGQWCRLIELLLSLSPVVLCRALRLRHGNKSRVWNVLCLSYVVQQVHCLLIHRNVSWINSWENEYLEEKSLRMSTRN